MEREKTELRNCQNDSPTERNSCVLLKKEKVVGITKVMNIHCLGESDYKNQSTHSWTISVFEANQVVSIHTNHMDESSISSRVLWSTGGVYENDLLRHFPIYLYCYYQIKTKHEQTFCFFFISLHCWVFLAWMQCTSTLKWHCSKHKLTQ